jgi:hypothetical protein
LVVQPLLELADRPAPPPCDSSLELAFVPGLEVHETHRTVQASSMVATGFQRPVVIRDMAGSGLVAPSSLEDMVSMLGGDAEVPILDVASQGTHPVPPMQLDTFLSTYWKTPSQRETVLSVPAIEPFLEEEFPVALQPPLVVQQLDLLSRCWPEARTLAGESPATRYCLSIAAKSAVSEFSVPASGEALWRSVLQGEELVLMVPGTMHNAQSFVDWQEACAQDLVSGRLWRSSEDEALAWDESEVTDSSPVSTRQRLFGVVRSGLWFQRKHVDGAVVARLCAGQSVLVPEGWLSAVVSLADSVSCFGYWQPGLNLSAALRVRKLSYLLGCRISRSVATSSSSSLSLRRRPAGDGSLGTETWGVAGAIAQELFSRLSSRWEAQGMLAPEWVESEFQSVLSDAVSHASDPDDWKPIMSQCGVSSLPGMSMTSDWFLLALLLRELVRDRRCLTAASMTWQLLSGSPKPTQRDLGASGDSNDASADDNRSGEESDSEQLLTPAKPASSASSSSSAVAPAQSSKLEKIALLLQEVRASHLGSPWFSPWHILGVAVLLHEVSIGWSEQFEPEGGGYWSSSCKTVSASPAKRRLTLKVGDEDTSSSFDHFLPRAFDPIPAADAAAEAAAMLRSGGASVQTLHSHGWLTCCGYSVKGDPVTSVAFPRMLSFWKVCKRLPAENPVRWPLPTPVENAAKRMKPSAPVVVEKEEEDWLEGNILAPAALEEVEDELLDVAALDEHTPSDEEEEEEEELVRRKPKVTVPKPKFSSKLVLKRAQPEPTRPNPEPARPNPEPARPKPSPARPRPQVAASIPSKSAMSAKDRVKAMRSRLAAMRR